MLRRKKVKFVVAGVDVSKMANWVREAGGDRVEAQECSDMQGAKIVKNGDADYYLGTCWSGGGGALAAATIILGQRNVAIVGTPGLKPKPDKVKAHVKNGKKAFGFPQEQSEKAINVIVKTILELNQ